MTQQVSIVQYSILKNLGAIVSISLGSDGNTVTVTSRQFDSITGVPMQDLVTLWSLIDINNQIIYCNSQIDNFNAVVADAMANKAR
jgi:hypothetical protein